MSKKDARKQMLFSLDKGIDGIKRSMNAVTYNALVAVITRLDELSPVGNVRLWKRPKNHPPGYRGGQFRGNWQLGVGSIPVGWFPGKIDPAGFSTVAANISAIPMQASRYKYYLVNNVPYALAIEQGHSTQAPKPILFQVKREFNGIVRKVAQDIKDAGGRVR